MKRDIYIFRHGETDYNANKRMQGWLDVPLNKNGIAQAEILSKKMSDIKLDCIYSVIAGFRYSKNSCKR